MDKSDYTAEGLVLDESFQRYCLGVDPSAKDYWENWLAGNPEKHGEFFKAKELYAVLNGGIQSLNFEKDRAVFYNRLVQEGILQNGHKESKVIPLQAETGRKNKLYRLLAVAAVFAVLVFGAYMILKKDNAGPQLADSKKSTIDDRAPGTNKAILTFANGKTIILDSSATGVISQQGGVKVINVTGLLTYEDGDNSSEVLFNTISTPKGGQYQLILADGSKVWLNAASSLRFPTAFIGSDRSVELTGEGYFEVAHNPNMPFNVKMKGMEVEVLGTHFNVNAYDDEPTSKTTLLEGKVKVKKNEKHVILTPGQQALMQSGQDNLRIDYDVDVEEVVAWKNGFMHFDVADIGAIMRQISRWYNIEVGYSGDIKSVHLEGKISRNVNLSQLINILQESGIDIKMEGNKLIAIPKP